jgi:hypothetical protein
MLFARIVLTFTGLVFFVHGLVCFIHPATIGLESGLAMPTPSSLIEVRAEYGGLPIALGLFFLAAAFQKIEVRTGLIVMLTVVTGYATSRIAAVLMTGHFDQYNLAAITYEATTALLGAWAITKLPKRGQTRSQKG